MVDACGRFKRYVLLISADYETRITTPLLDASPRPGTSSAEGQPCSVPKRRDQRIPNTRTFYHLSLLQIAVCNRDAHLIPHLVCCGEDVDGRAVGGLTALHLASADLNKETMRALLDCGANVNLTMLQTQKSALHIAVGRSSLKCGIVLEAGKECIDLLLRHGANLHLKDSDGQEAIHLACRGGREDLVSLLLDYGADVNSLTELGESPLFLLLEKKLSLRKGVLLEKVLGLSYPLKLTNHEGRLPNGLSRRNSQELRERLVRLSLEVWPLQDICKFHLRKMYGGKAELRLKEKIPTNLWNSIAVNQEFSYASKLKRL
ncbi:ankyrin repeat domain-containing protein 61 [Tiliqua scincoides]|uniref:ankyrin repeat domain-containing protein 61 n=1 Tax=Tiliqua scincoides TaxID=71010 RepID=UPI0034637FD9